MNFPPAFGGRVRNLIWQAGLLLILPLAFHRGFAEPFSTPKYFLTKFIVISGLAVWGLGVIWTRERRAWRFPLVLPLLAFSVMILISCLTSPVPRFSIVEAEYALCGPAWLLLLASWEQGDAAVRKIAAMMGLAGALVAGIAMLQQWGFDPVMLGGYQVDWGSMVARMRLYSTFGNPNFVGGYLIGIIFVALSLAAASKSHAGRAVWLICALMMLAAIVVTASHGAWLGLALGAMAAAIFLLPSSGSRAQAIPHGAGDEDLRSFAAPIAFWPLALLTLSWAERIAAQLEGRVYLWRFSWPVFWQHPLVGSGWGSYQILYLELQGRFIAAHPDYVGYWTNNRLLHNDPLQLVLETGLLGTAAFLWILFEFGRQAWEMSRQSTGGWARYALAASVGGVTAILTDSLFNYQFAVPPTYILLFTLLAIPTILHNHRRETGNGERPLLRARFQSWQSVGKVAGSMAILTAAGGLLWQQTRVLESERLYQMASDQEDRNDPAGAENAFRHSVRLNDLNGRAHFGLSRVLSSRGQSSEALEEIVQAERTYADSHQEVLRGFILEEMGRNREALEAYRHAFWLDPTLTSVQENIERLSKTQ